VRASAGLYRKLKLRRDCINARSPRQFINRSNPIGLKSGLLLITAARRSNPPAQVNRFGAFVILDPDARKNQDLCAGATRLGGSS